MDKSFKKNADRFSGFADVYDSSRPEMPLYPIEIIKKYLGKAPDTVIDLGCGTGLSSIIWRGNCKKLIGIEPSDDMLSQAVEKADETLSFRKGFGHDTGMSDSCADVVICSQSFHWMEPRSTLKEINRILKQGGVFATVDCDWPPVCSLNAEKSYSIMYKKVKQIESDNPEVRDSFIRYPKDEHLSNIKASGYFSYAREIVFSNREKCNADRLIGLLLSQGSTQAILKRDPDAILDNLERFKSCVKTDFGDTEHDIEFSYRMRIGIK